MVIDFPCACSFHGEKDEEGFTCELCGRYYNEKRKLRSHLRNRHKGFRLQEDEGYMCWQCWQAFPEIKILEEHIITVHGRGELKYHFAKLYTFGCLFTIIVQYRKQKTKKSRFGKV